MINNLIKLSTYLDSAGLYKEADRVDSLIEKIAQATIEIPEEKLVPYEKATADIAKLFIDYANQQVYSFDTRYNPDAWRQFFGYKVYQVKGKPWYMFTLRTDDSKAIVERALYNMIKLKKEPESLLEGVARLHLRNLGGETSHAKAKHYSWLLSEI